MQDLIELFELNKTTPITYLSIECGDGGPVVIEYKTTVNNIITTIEYEQSTFYGEKQGYYDQKNNIIIPCPENNQDMWKLENDRNYIRLPITKEESFVCNKLLELTSLETFIFGSCDGIYIPEVPDSLKILKLGHKSFNINLFEKITKNGGNIYIGMCCHIHSSFALIQNISEFNNFERHSYNVNVYESDVITDDPGYKCILCKFDKHNA